MDPVAIQDVTLKRPRPAVQIVGALVALATGTWLTQSAFNLTGHTALLMGMVVAIAALRGLNDFVPRFRAPRGRLVADERGIAVNDALVLPRAEVSQAYVQPMPRNGGNEVVLRLRKGGQRRIEVGSLEEGTRVTAALGLDAGRSTATFSIPSRIHQAKLWPWALGAVSIFGLAMRGGEMGPGIFIAMMMMFFGVMALGFVPGQVAVGADGVRVSWFGSDVMVPFVDVAGVVTDRKSARLLLVSGKEVPIWWAVSSRRSVDNGVREAIVARVREALAAYKARAAGASIEALARAGREPGEWVRALKTIGAGDDAALAYRSQSIPHEELWRVLEDPGAGAEPRAAAAVALSAKLDDEGKKRVRVVAEGTASPRLRVALDAVTGDDETAITDALASMELEDAAAKRT